MGKGNKHQNESERFGKCDICLEYIPIEYYFNKGDEITCYECGTEYILLSKSPVKLSMLETPNEPDYFYGEMMFDD